MKIWELTQRKEIFGRGGNFLYRKNMKIDVKLMKLVESTLNGKLFDNSDLGMAILGFIWVDSDYKPKSVVGKKKRKSNRGTRKQKIDMKNKPKTQESQIIVSYDD